MHYLVDAYNLLFRILKNRGPLQKNRQKLIEELNEPISKFNMHVTLVFDGAEEHFPSPTRGHFDAIELVYTPKNTSADAYIIEMVSHAKSPAQITVVSNDGEIAKKCRNFRAHTLSIDDFIHLLEKKEAKRARSAKSRAAPIRESSSELSRLLIIFEKRMLEDIGKDFFE